MPLRPYSRALAAAALLGAAGLSTAGEPVSGGAPTGAAASPAVTGQAESPAPADVTLPPPRSLGGVGRPVWVEPDPFAAAATACEPPAALPAEGFWGRCKRRLQQCFVGYPSEFEASPFGDSVYRHYKTHVANGDAARMTLYDYDFQAGGAALNWRGRDRLAEIQAMLPRNFCPVVVERTPGCPQLAESRRLAVLTELGQGPFPVPAERVVIGPPLAVGLQGDEAVIIYQNLLQQTRGEGAAGAASAAAPPGGVGATGPTGQPMGATSPTMPPP